MSWSQQPQPVLIREGLEEVIKPLSGQLVLRSEHLGWYWPKHICWGSQYEVERELGPCMSCGWVPPTLDELRPDEEHAPRKGRRPVILAGMGYPT